MPLPGGYLLDTNIVLALVRNNALGQHLDAHYGLNAAAHPFYVSIVSVGELFALANKFNWGPAKRTALANQLTPFATVSIDFAITQAYGAIDAAAAAAGRPMGKNDVWIAATARVTNTTLLTTDHNFDLLHGVWVDREWLDPSSNLPGP